MATKKLDVWVVERETVYREVPFTVVADWLQQGRLLGEDRVRLSGQEQWHLISAVSAFKPYLPGPAPAEARRWSCSSWGGTGAGAAKTTTKTST
jgi:hypothetical protein